MSAPESPPEAAQPSPVPEFNPSDVAALALAIAGLPGDREPAWLEWGTGDSWPDSYCRHCTEPADPTPYVMKHAEGCPVLVAQDVLTGDWWQKLVAS